MTAGLALTVASCSRPRSPAPTCPIQLVDATPSTGIRFVHYDGSSGQKYIVETVTAGLALFDYDGDGDEDIYFLNGAPLRGSKPGPTPTNALYRNDGQWKFTDVTDRSRPGRHGIRARRGCCRLRQRRRPGPVRQQLRAERAVSQQRRRNVFRGDRQRAGVGCGDKVGAGACFLDIDRDGDLDLYVANYVNFTYENHQIIWEKGFPTYISPRGYQPEPDVLYRNNGDGTFTDVSTESGIGLHAGTGMGIVGCDFDNDGDTDIFVLNDVAANFFFVNDGTGKFEEAGLATGTAYNGNGDATGSMGVDCGDYDNDGWLDLMMTTYQNELPVLYRNLGNGTFEDVTIAANAGDGAYPYVNWGVGLVDFDNDGDKDLFLANGHLQDNVGLYDDSTAYEVRNILLMNQGDGRFVNVSDQCGDGLLPARSSRGAGFDDLDGDGDGGRGDPQFPPRADHPEERIAGRRPLDSIATPRYKSEPRCGGNANSSYGGRADLVGRGPQRPRLPEPLWAPAARGTRRQRPRGPVGNPLAGRRRHGAGKRAGGSGADRGTGGRGLRRTEFNFAGQAVSHRDSLNPAKLNSVRLSPYSSRQRGVGVNPKR